MTDVADLRIRATTEGVSGAARELDNLSKSGASAERATDSLMGTIGKFVGAATIATTVLGSLNKLVSTQRQFDVLNAGLVTATGSAEKASVAFDALVQFAQKTPYDLNQAVEGFTKLVNLGLTPSERAMTSYGNTASAMGKSLNQMIEAVADAATGEFERLKEFGIKAKQHGDQVSLTFQGVTTNVGNNAAAIEKYLIGLGENQFAGAMEQRMKTLDGAISNLGDSWDAMFRNVSKSGVGDAIAEAVNVASDALNGINNWLQSGELEGAISSLGVSFGPWVQDAKDSAEMVQSFLKGLGDYIEQEYPGIGDELSSAFKDFPENIRAIVQLATVHIAWFIEQVKIGAQEIWGYLQAIHDGVGGLQVKDVYAQARAAEENNKKTLAETTDEILRNTQASKDSAKAARQAAIDKAAAAKKERESRTGDQLAGFGKGGKGGANSSGKAKKPKKDHTAEREQRDYESLVDDLRTEEEALQVSYDKRKAIIEKHHGIEASKRQELMQRLDAWRNKEAEQIQQHQNREVEGVKQSLMTQEEAIQASYDKRRKILLDAKNLDEATRADLLARLNKEKTDELAQEQTERQNKHDRLMEASMGELDILRSQFDEEMRAQQKAEQDKLISHEEFLKNKAALEKKYNDLVRQREIDQKAQTLQVWGDMYGSFGQLAEQFAHGQGKNAKRMFEISKALYMTQTIMMTSAAVMKAYSDPALQYPLNIVAAVAAAAKGAVEIASISQQQFSGAYDKGGSIPAGKFGVVGERGMEIVQGPANVTGREDTARLLRRAADGGGGGDTTNNNVTIQVVLGQNGSATTSTSASSDGTDAERAKQLGQMIDLRVRDVLIREHRQGGMLNPNSR